MKLLFKPMIFIYALITLITLSFDCFFILPTYALARQLSLEMLQQNQKFGEWYYFESDYKVPTLLWWNERMPMVPVLYLFFYPDKIKLNAITPNWSDTGMIFYIKDNTEKLGINLIFEYKDSNHNYYTATIYNEDRQNFINHFVTSHKARLITPSSYSQSLSLKDIRKALQLIFFTHPYLNLNLPSSPTY